MLVAIGNVMYMGTDYASGEEIPARLEELEDLVELDIVAYGEISEEIPAYIIEDEVKDIPEEKIVEEVVEEEVSEVDIPKQSVKEKPMKSSPKKKSSIK
jgi:hypothetical protein